MQISSFSGGLNRRASPFLLQSNEGVEYSNIDTTSGSLAPIYEDKDLNAKIKPSFINFNSHWVNSDESRDYVKFQDKLFYSNGSSRPQWSSDGFTWYGLGVDKPDTAPVISSFNVRESQDTFEVEYESISAAILDFPEWLDRTGWYFPSDTQPYEVVMYKKFTVESNTFTSYVRDSFVSKYPYGSAIQLSTQGLFCYIKEPSNPRYFRYTKTDIAVGFSIVPNMAVPETKTTDTLDPDTVFVQTQENTEYEFLIFKLKDGETIYSSVETKKLEIDTSTSMVKYIKLTTQEELDSLKVFVEGYSMTCIQSNLNPLDWYILLDTKGISLEKFINNESISALEYVYTYTTDEGAESLPSDSAEFPILLYPTYVKVEASTDPQVTGINVYRLGGSLSQYSLIAKLPNVSQTFVDDLGDSEIDGSVLNSYNNLPAPEGLNFLTLYNTILFGSIGDKLYYTDIATPFAWSGFNFIDFDDVITGIGGTSNGLLVFTRHSTYIITGTSPDTFSKYVLSSGVGCVLHKSIQSLQNTLLWLSEDSICASNGGQIQTLSRDKLNILNLQTPRCSAVLNDIYYLSHNNGTLIADFRFGLTFRESNRIYYGLCVHENSLYGVESDDKFVEINKGSKPLSIKYKSPKFSDGSISTMKLYKDIYFYSSGELEVKVYIDDQLAATQTLNSGFTEIKVKAEDTRGYSIQFDVRGTGTLHEIEYKVEERQNGR